MILDDLVEDGAKSALQVGDANDLMHSCLTLNSTTKFAMNYNTATPLRRIRVQSVLQLGQPAAACLA